MGEWAKHGCDAIFAGDVIHSRLQLAFPELSGDFRINLVQALESRFKLLYQIAADNSLLIPAHFPNHGLLQIENIESGFKPKFVS